MKQTPAHDIYNQSIFSILCDLKPHKVVEVGCMRGALAKAYLDLNPECQWHGIDIDEDNIKTAQHICTKAVTANIEHLTLADLKGYEDADLWIFADVLEHLYNPWELLRKLKLNACKEFNVLACIPNSQHWSFQARINSGMMQYENEGLFDRTHIRFFSRITMIELFQQSGFEIQKMLARNFDFPGSTQFMPHIRAMAEVNGLDPAQAEKDATAFQYVVCAHPKS
jgi:2-polyprenyl-3-methyl-5-hydroxy-6-metoxy-1,4-benzoquinol methylase